MDPVEIVFELRRRGLSQVAVAARLGVAHATVNNVIHGRATSYRIASYIADVLQQRLEVLWPGRYEFKPRGKAVSGRAR